MKQVPGPGSKHGIYMYQDGSWRLIRSDGDPLRLEEAGDGVVVVYFDNALCPACRVQDRYWLDVVSRFSGSPNIRFYVVLCDWFADQCNSEAASKSFKTFGIAASPTIVVAAVKDGKVVYREALEGVRESGVISLYIKEALNKASQ